MSEASAEETREQLKYWAKRLLEYSYREDILKIKVSTSERRPLVPVYMSGTGEFTGDYIQHGPRAINIYLEDFAKDGQMLESPEE